MEVFEYVKNLLPVFKKTQLLNGSASLIQDINEHVIPAFVSAEALFRGRKFVSKEAQDYAEQLDRRIGKQTGTNVIGNILFAFTNAVKILEMFNASSLKNYSEEETNLSLDYAKAAQLKMLDSVGFASAYARKFLNYIIVLETSEADDAFKVGDAVKGKELIWIRAGFEDFAIALAAMKKKPEEVKKLLDAVTPSIVSEMSNKVLSGTVSADKIDPFKFSMMSVTSSPFYFFGMFIVERQAARYKAAAEELQLLQLRLMNLKQVQAKEPDAAIQRQIDAMEGRVQIKSDEIMEMEKEYLNG